MGARRLTTRIFSGIGKRLYWENFIAVVKNIWGYEMSCDVSWDHGGCCAERRSLLKFYLKQRRKENRSSGWKFFEVLS